MGYLGDVADPFIEAHGKKWYRTGDLGYLDEKGNIVLSGRLKRFTKVGGEMISLGGVEMALHEVLEKGQEKPTLAVCSKEKDFDKPMLILFTTNDVNTENVNDILRNAGFSRLVRISEVRKIDEIPLMGSGKIDYRKLQSMV